MMRQQSILLSLCCLLLIEQHFTAGQSAGQTCTCAGGCGNNGLTSADGKKVNIAYGKPANISTTYRDTRGQSGPACVAVNGRTDTVYRSIEEGNVNCVHTDRGDNSAWWQVDLGDNYSVSDITIYSRSDGYQTRMAGLRVYVDNQLCYSFTDLERDLNNLPEKIDITCTVPVIGRVVKFQKDGQNRANRFNYINICEVQIWSPSSLITVPAEGSTQPSTNRPKPNRPCPKSHHCITTDINDETVASFAEEWENELTAAAGNVSSAENVTAIKERVVVFAGVLQQIKSNVTKVDHRVAEKLLASVDIVSQLYSTVLGQEKDTDDTQNRIIQAVEVLGEKIALDSAENGTVRLVTNNIALEVWNLSRVLDDDFMVSDEYTLGLQLKTVDGRPSSSPSDESLHQITDTVRPDNSETDIAIQIPASILQATLKENAGKDVRMSMSIFLTPSLFEHGTLERMEDEKSTTKSLVLNSKVIMASITVDGKPVSEPFGKDRYVTTVFLSTDEYKDLNEEDHRRHSVCVFWDFLGAGGRGSWSDKGCHVDKLDKGRVVCACNHLTNFAVLFDLDFNQQWNNNTSNQRILSFVSIVGLGFSIVGLSCTVISFIAIRKWRKGRPQQTIFNMSLAMLFAWVIFLAGFSRVENRVGCLAVAVLLHYFILASFIWMLVEAILQYLLIIKVMGNSFRHFMTKTVFPAWGLPLVPVIVLLSIDVEMYNGYENYCWMSRNAFYFAFLIPVSVLMIFNIIVYVMVVVKLCRLPNVGRTRSTGASHNLVSIRTSIGAFVMLGLSWVFAYLTVTGAGGVFHYLFTITTTIQGLLIFLLFTARDPVVEAFWRQQFQKCRLAAAGTNCCGKGRYGMDPAQEIPGTSESHVTPSKIEMSQIL